MKILIFGLPGSGKTTLAKELTSLYDFKHLNADDIRKEFNDWDFSKEGRVRQFERMVDLNKKHADTIVDFVCPFNDLRKELDVDLFVWMNTIDKSRFEDTNLVFEPPSEIKNLIEINDFNSKIWALRINKYLNSGTLKWENTYPTVQMLGRWQPFHDGHMALFKECFKKSGQVNIQVRSMPITSSNPFEFEDVKKYIIKKLTPEYKENYDYVITQVPNITKICWGRDVGYEFEQINLSDDITKISATEIRKALLG